MSVATLIDDKRERNSLVNQPSERARRASETAEQWEEWLGMQPSQSNKDKHFFNLGGKQGRQSFNKQECRIVLWEQDVGRLELPNHSN